MDEQTWAMAGKGTEGGLFGSPHGIDEQQPCGLWLGCQHHLLYGHLDRSMVWPMLCHFQCSAPSGPHQPTTRCPTLYTHIDSPSPSLSPFTIWMTTSQTPTGWLTSRWTTVTEQTHREPSSSFDFIQYRDSSYHHSLWGETTSNPRSQFVRND